MVNDKAGSLKKENSVFRIKFPQEDLLITKALRKSVGGFSQDHWIYKTG